MFGASGHARAFDDQGGDVGDVTFSIGHSIENTGGETLRLLETFRHPIDHDVSVRQWLAVIPPELVEAHLDLPDAVIAGLPKTKALLVG